MHPDKFSMDAELMSDEERRKDMEDNYKKVNGRVGLASMSLVVAQRLSLRWHKAAFHSTLFTAI